VARAACSRLARLAPTTPLRRPRPRGDVRSMAAATAAAPPPPGDEAATAGAGGGGDVELKAGIAGFYDGLSPLWEVQSHRCMYPF
jgi:hypothetical protein